MDVSPAEGLPRWLDDATTSRNRRGRAFGHATSIWDATGRYTAADRSYSNDGRMEAVSTSRPGRECADTSGARLHAGKHIKWYQLMTAAVDPSKRYQLMTAAVDPTQPLAHVG